MKNLSFKILLYNVFLNNFIPFITTTANVTRFGWTTIQVTAFTNLLTSWNLKYADYINPLNFGSTTIIDAINTAYQAAFAVTQGARNQLIGNTTIILTSAEKSMCNIKDRDNTRTSTGIPKNAPTLACIFISMMMMRFAALNPLLPFKKAKPPYAHSIGVKIAITGPGALPPADSDYVRQDDETDTVFETLFTAAQVGKTAYVKVFYINSRSEAGPDSIPYIISIA